MCTINLSACAATVTDTYGPNGEQAYSIDCSGEMMTWDACQTAAGDKCGARGYKILNKTSEGEASAGGSSSFFAASAYHNRTMLIACK